MLATPCPLAGNCSLEVPRFATSPAGLVFRPASTKGCGFGAPRSRMQAERRAWEDALGAYLVRRFGLMLMTLFGISVIIFLLLRLTPGNIADILFDAGGFVDPADKARIEAHLGLDRPLPVQYFNWVGGLLHGDLGMSYQTERPAIEEIAPRIPITAKLAGLALTFSVLFGVPLGVISAVKQNTRLDYVLRVISLSGLSMPSFWLGLLILMAFVAYMARSRSTPTRPTASGTPC